MDIQNQGPRQNLLKKIFSKKNKSSSQIDLILFQIYDKIMMFSIKKKRSSLQINLEISEFHPKIIVFSKKKGLHMNSFSDFSLFVTTS